MERYYMNKKRGVWNTRIFFVACSILLIGIGLFVINKRYEKSLRNMEERTLALSKSVEAFLCNNCLISQEANLESETALETAYIKEGLDRFVQYNENVSSAYLYTQNGDEINVLINFEKPDSQVSFDKKYLKSIKLYRQPFIDGESLIVKPGEDDTITWVSALIPITDPKTENVIAVFGTDYSAQKWYSEITRHVVHASLMLALIFLILIAFFLSQKNNKKSLALSENLQKSEGLFRTVFEQAPIGIGIWNSKNYIVKANGMLEKITKRTQHELTKIKWNEITHPDDLKNEISNFEKVKAGEIDGYSMKKRYIKKDGSVAWVYMTVTVFNLHEKSEQTFLCLVQDISRQVKAEEALAESERSKTVLLSHLPGMAYRCNNDRDWTMQYVSMGCYALTGYESKKLLYNRDLSYNELIAPEHREILRNEWKRVLAAKSDFRHEYEIITATGERKWVLELGQGIFNEANEVEALEGIVIEITEQKKKESQIQYMSVHDYMTGLYNRYFFENEKQNMDKESNLPLSIIVVSINGLRLINDAFGHSYGDKVIFETANIVQNCCRQQDVVARTGSDEFSVIMPNANEKTTSDIVKRIFHECEIYNEKQNLEYNISISVGFCVKESMDVTMNDVIKDANNNMHNNKLLNQKSSHSTIISSIMTTMYIRSQETEEHAVRLANISKKIGELLNLSQKDMDNLELFAMLHDIGKVGIDDSILNKPGKLTDEEWVIMKRHAEIGYRIAMSSPELEKIAEYILTHHERWDGKGYPRGLKGEQIPLLSRILAVADSYDAMTEDRVYRKAMSHEEAIKEIKQNAGTQFDPYIAKIFIENVRKA